MYDHLSNHYAGLDQSYPEVHQLLAPLNLSGTVALDFAIHFSDYVAAVIVDERLGLGRVEDLRAELQTHADAWRDSGRCAAPAEKVAHGDWLSARFDVFLSQRPDVAGEVLLDASIASKQHRRDAHGPACHPEFAVESVAHKIQDLTKLELVESNAHGRGLRALFRLTSDEPNDLTAGVNVMRQRGFTISTKGPAFDAKDERRARKDDREALRMWDERDIREASSLWSPSKDLLATLNGRLWGTGVVAQDANPGKAAFFSAVVEALTIGRNPVLAAVGESWNLEAQYKFGSSAEEVARFVTHRERY